MCGMGMHKRDYINIHCFIQPQTSFNNKKLELEQKKFSLFFCNKLIILDWPVEEERKQDWTHVDHKQLDDPLP